jgi:hypothetical protein
LCPRCGATGPGAGPDDESLDDLKAGRRRLFLTGFACLFIGLVMGSGSSWVNFGQRDFWSGGPPASAWPGRTPALATAGELVETYRDDRQSAQRRYSRRPLIVTGNVVRVDQHAQFGPDILLSTSDAAKPLRVDLLKDSHDASDALVPGAAVTVGCQHVEEHIGPDPWLRNCRILESGAALAAPPGVPATGEAKPRLPTGS